MNLIAALVLDAFLGEPRWLWSRLTHPAILMGRAVAMLDYAWNTGAYRRLRGLAALATLTGSGAALGLTVAALPGAWLSEPLIAAILLAQRSLSDHVSDVAHALRAGLPQGRTAVARIVGRDTSDMDSSAIARAAIESAAENLSDGVVAPAFWFLVAGLPGLIVYKVANTADSMIGYRTDRHRAFGWASARCDDLLNWIPARLTAALIWAASGARGSWPAMIRDARLHRSPNAGWPEAAMAASLNVALAGPRSYDGVRRDFPWVNAQGHRFPGPETIEAAVRALWRTWAAGLAIVIAIAVV